MGNKATLTAVMLATASGWPYTMWKIETVKTMLLLTPLELERAQRRGRDYKREMKERVAKQSAILEAEAFGKAHPGV